MQPSSHPPLRTSSDTGDRLGIVLFYDLMGSSAFHLRLQDDFFVEDTAYFGVASSGDCRPDQEEELWDR